MPYTVQPPVRRGARQTLAEARWDAMVAAKPDLAPAVHLQRHLIGAVLRVTEALEQARPPRFALPPRYLTTKIAAGIPALAGEPIPVPTEALKPTLLELCRVLADGGGGEASIAIRVAVEGGHVDVAALMTLTLRREQAALRAVATRAGLGHDLLWLVADLAVGPFAHVLRCSLFDRSAADSALRSGLDAWSHGWCPLCGSWPGFAEVVNGQRVLRCAFCAAAWAQAAEACVYCAATGNPRVLLAPGGGQAGRLAETCSACRGYLKRVTSDALLPFPLLPLADLDSMDLDLAAMNHGFARPAIRSFSSRR